MGLIIVEEVVVGAGWRTSCRTSDDFVDWTLCQVPRYVHLRFAWYKQYAVWVYRLQVMSLRRRWRISLVRLSCRDFFFARRDFVR